MNRNLRPNVEEDAGQMVWFPCQTVWRLLAIVVLYILYSILNGWNVRNVAGYVFKVDTFIHPHCFPYSKYALSRFASLTLNNERIGFPRCICCDMLNVQPFQAIFHNYLYLAIKLCCYVSWKTLSSYLLRCPKYSRHMRPMMLVCPEWCGDPDLTLQLGRAAHIWLL